MVNLKSTFIQDFIARSSYMTDRLQIIQENFYNSKTSMELHYMLPRWYLVVKMHRCSIVMENILEEYFGAIYQIFVYLPLTCYEIWGCWNFSISQMISDLLAISFKYCCHCVPFFWAWMKSMIWTCMGGIMPQSWTLGNIGQPKCCFGFIFWLQQRLNEEGGFSIIVTMWW